MLSSVIDVGELRETLIVQKEVKGIDEDGFPIEGFQDLYKLRCKVKTVSTKEYMSANRDTSKITLKFICRKRDMNNDMVILYKNARFNILNIHVIDPFFVEITAELQK